MLTIICISCKPKANFEKENQHIGSRLVIFCIDTFFDSSKPKINFNQNFYLLEKIKLVISYQKHYKI